MKYLATNGYTDHFCDLIFFSPMTMLLLTVCSRKKLLSCHNSRLLGKLQDLCSTMQVCLGTQICKTAVKKIK